MDREASQINFPRHLSVKLWKISEKELKQFLIFAAGVVFS